jgi:MoxR-like ATPase
MDLIALSKPQLNEVLKRVSGRGRDMARNNKQDYLDALAVFPAEAVADAANQVGLISGVFTTAAQSTPVPTAVDEAVPEVEIVARKTLAELFGIRGKYAKFEVDVWNDPAAPELDSLYKFDADQLYSAVTAIARGRNTWLAGPAGTGKTEFVKNLCAGLGRAFVRVSFDSGAERYEFIGGERVRNGTTVYQRGVVLRGFTRPGAVILLDEVSFARPEYLSALHAALEPSGVVTIPETGEVVRKAPGVVFMAADNSNGRGDYTGMYVGVREQNVAFVNRFARTINFSYLDQASEAKVVAARSGCTIQLAEVLVGFMNVARQAGESAQLDHVPTLREVFYLAEALTDGLNYRAAFEQCMVNRASPESAEVLQQLWKGNIAESSIEFALEGKTRADVLAEPVVPTEQEVSNVI